MGLFEEYFKRKRRGAESVTQPTDSFDTKNFQFDTGVVETQEALSEIDIDSPSIKEPTGLTGLGTTRDKGVSIKQPPVIEIKTDTLDRDTRIAKLMEEAKLGHFNYVDGLGVEDKDLLLEGFRKESNRNEILTTAEQNFIPIHEVEKLGLPTGGDKEVDILGDIGTALNIGRDQAMNATGKVIGFLSQGKYGKGIQEQALTSLRREQAKFKDPIEEVDILDSRFWTQTLPQQIPFMLELGVYGAGGALAGGAGAGALGLGELGTYLSTTAIAGLTSRLAESVIEGSDTYSTLREEGKSNEVANRQAINTIGDNMALVFSDIAQMAVTFAPGSKLGLNKVFSAAGKFVFDSLSEGGEEVWQGYSSQYNIAVGLGEDPISIKEYIGSQQAQDEFTVGAAAGLVFGSAGVASDVWNNLGNRVQAQDDFIDKAIKDGDLSFQGKVQLLMDKGVIDPETGTAMMTNFTDKLKENGMTYQDFMDLGVAKLEKRAEELMGKVKRFEFDKTGLPKGAIGEIEKEAFDSSLDQYADDVKKGKAFQELPKEPEKKLVALHNLSESKLQKIKELGGLPGPSIAITESGIPFEDFGDITLVGNKDLIESSKAKTFSSDIYSPRVPSPDYKSKQDKIIKPKIEKLNDELEKYGTRGWELFSDLEQDAAYGSYPLHIKFAKDNNIPIKIIKKLDVPNQLFMGGNPLKRLGEEKIRSLIPKEFPQSVEETIKVGKDILKKAFGDDVNKVITEDYGFHDADALMNYLRGFSKGKVLDRISTMSNIRNQIQKKGLEDKYDNFTDDLKSELFDKKLFKGFTYSGNKQYKDYTLENILKDMFSGGTKGTESSMFSGNLSQTLGKEAKELSLSQVKKQKFGKSPELDKKYEALKDEWVNIVGWDGASVIDDFFYTTRSNESILSSLHEYDNGKKFNDGDIQRLKEIMVEAKELPKGYIETKIKRGVDLDEFSFIIVPESQKDKVLEILKGTRLENRIETYKTEAERTSIIKNIDDKYGEVKFQKPDKTTEKIQADIGYYDALKLAPKGWKIDIVPGLKTDEGELVSGQADRDKKVISISKEHALKTVGFHEAFHAGLSEVSEEERQDIIKELRNQYKEAKNDMEAEEFGAEELFYYAENKEFKTKTLSGKIKEFIKDLWNKIKGVVGKDNKLKILYDDILSGKLKEGFDTNVGVAYQKIPKGESGLPDSLVSIFNKLKSSEDRSLRQDSLDKYTKIEELKDENKNFKIFYDEATEYINSIGADMTVQSLYDRMGDIYVDESELEEVEESREEVEIQKKPEEIKTPELSDIYDKKIIKKGKLPNVGGLLEILRKSLVPIDTLVGEIDKGLKDALRKFEYGVLNSGLIQQARPILSGLNEKLKGKKKSEEYRILDIAFKNNDTPVVNEYVKKLGISDEVKKMKLLLDEYYAFGIEYGMDIKYLEDYFPRVVKDAKGLLSAIYNTEYGGLIQEAIKAEEMKLGRKLNKEEMAGIADKMLRGYEQNGIRLTAPGNVKERSVEEVTSDLDQYYYNSLDALAIYVQTMNENIEARKLFGKGDNLEESIGTYTMGLIADGKITPEQEIELSRLLKARFTNKKMDSFIQSYKNATYLATMGNPISAITQIQDLVFSLYANGYINTIFTLAKRLVGKAKIKKEDLGVTDIIHEFKERGSLQGAVTKVFKLVGLDKMDAIGKEVLINAAYKKLQKEVKNGDYSGLDALTNKDQAIKDLKNDNVSEDIKYILFSKLLDFQPLTQSQLPEYYNTSGNMRLLYMLKTYTIKQIDTFRRESFSMMNEGWKAGDTKQFAKGFTNMVRLSAALMLLGIPTDELKNLMLNRETTLPDLVTDNILKLMGFSKYTIYKARVEGVSAGVLSLVVPPFSLLDDPARDFYDIFNNKFESVKSLRTIKDIPVGGKLYYWWFGRKADSKKKPESIRSKVLKSRTSTRRATPRRAAPRAIRRRN